MSIYWPDNATFYDGEVIGFDNVTLRHHVMYDSGDQEHLILDTAKVPLSARSLPALDISPGNAASVQIPLP